MLIFQPLPQLLIQEDAHMTQSAYGGLRATAHLSNFFGKESHKSGCRYLRTNESLPWLFFISNTKCIYLSKRES